jgi:hypothetical protein
MHRTLSLVADVIAGIVFVALIIYPRGPLVVSLALIGFAVGCLILSRYLRRSAR